MSEALSRAAVAPGAANAHRWKAGRDARAQRSVSASMPRHIAKYSPAGKRVIAIDDGGVERGYERRVKKVEQIGSGRTPAFDCAIECVHRG